MAKVKKGELFSCLSCGLVLIVDEPCPCPSPEVVCCGAPMGKGKAAAEKARRVLSSKEGEKPKKEPRKCGRKKL